jgi:hypothetical protein
MGWSPLAAPFRGSHLTPTLMSVVMATTSRENEKENLRIETFTIVKRIFAFFHYTFRYRIENRAVDPDPAFQVDPDPIRILGFDDQKLKKKNTTENFFIFF